MIRRLAAAVIAAALLPSALSVASRGYCAATTIHARPRRTPLRGHGVVSNVAGVADLALAVAGTQQGVLRTFKTPVQDVTDKLTGADRGSLNYQRGEVLGLFTGLLGIGGAGKVATGAGKAGATSQRAATTAAKTAAAVPDETAAVIRSIQKDGVIVQSGVKGPSVPKSFANDGRSGGQLLPTMDRGGHAINYRE